MGEHSIDLKHLISAPDYSIRMKEGAIRQQSQGEAADEEDIRDEVDVLNQSTSFKPLLKCSPTRNLR